MMLSIRDLKVSFGKTQILRGVDLHLERGDCLALVGESGGGKTTLGLAIMGLARGSASGEISFQGKDLLKISEEDLRELRGREMAMVFQNVEDALDPVQRIKDQIAEAILVHRSISAENAGDNGAAASALCGPERRESQDFIPISSAEEKSKGCSSPWHLSMILIS